MNPLQDGCACAACVALRAEMGTDPVMLALYGRKLLYGNGWAGKLSPAERAYRLAHSEKASRAASRMRLIAEKYPHQTRQRSLGGSAPIEHDPAA